MSKRNIVLLVLLAALAACAHHAEPLQIAATAPAAVTTSGDTAIGNDELRGQFRGE